MRQRLVGMVFAAISTAGVGTMDAQEPLPAVRPEEPAVRALIALGMAESETFRDLVTRLDASDVVVYIRSSRCLGNVSACLLWASESGGSRRLVIKLDIVGRSPH